MYVGAEFIFYHYPRTGGTSLMQMLDGKQVGGAHAAFTEPHNRYEFTIVRNPFDYMVSLFTYIQVYQSHLEHGIVVNMTFENFIEWYGTSPDMGERDAPYSKYMTQCDFTQNSVHVYRFENYKKEVERLFSELGLFIPKISHVNKSHHKKYREYYTVNSRAMVEELFKNDLAHFDYKY